MFNFAHFASFLTNVVLNDSKHPILVIAHFFPIFPYKSDFKTLRTPNFDHFALLPIFSYQSGPEQFGMLNFGHFTLFSNLFQVV